MFRAISTVLLIFLMTTVVMTVFAQSTPENSAQAKTFIDALAQQKFTTAYDHFSDEVKNQLTVDGLKELWSSITEKFGALKEQQKVVKAKIKGVESVVTICEFEKDKLAIAIVFGESGKIKGFFFQDPKEYENKEAPKYEAPSYSDLKSFAEKEVVVGQGQWLLPATLTIPNDVRNAPVVILVHGSGANDRDETHINPANKPFKDLAWGLASRGIAVLRYEKRNKQYPKEFDEIKSRTVNDETVNDAIAAVNLLESTPNIDAKNIYVLGHSLGGMMIPRIGGGNSKLAGLIIMAGAARPLEDTIWEQYNYLMPNGENSIPQEKALLLKAKQDVATVKSSDLVAVSPEQSLLGFRASYWLDWKNYYPSKEVKSLTQRMLILQGEQDYQVTMNDFQIWKSALIKNKNATFRSYPNLTHLFMEGSGSKPSPDDYAKTNHINQEVIYDIAKWILKENYTK